MIAGGPGSSSLEAAAVSTEQPVVVIGAGPAGATCATVLAQQGVPVTVFERERFPRFHIGESLIPMTYEVFARLGLVGRLQQSAFVKKFSVQFVTEHGKLSEPFYFEDHRPGEASQTWQVLRSEFDQLLVGNARAAGAQIEEGVRVLEVLFDGPRAVGVKVQREGEPPREVPASVVVDASGMSTTLMSRLGLRQWDPDLKKAALWTYYQGAKRDQGRDEGATLILQLKDKAGWFWYIPLHNDLVSVGVVAGVDYLFGGGRGGDHEAIFHEEVSRCAGLIPRLEGALRVAPFRAAKEYSYRTSQPAGDGWVLIGDAYGFLDPLYSSGVLLALKSGALAADAIAAGLRGGDLSGRQLGCWAPEFNLGMDRMRRLVCAFYDGLSFGKLIKKHPFLKGVITDMLIGDFFKSDVDVLWPLLDAFQREEQAALAAM